MLASEGHLPTSTNRTPAFGAVVRIGCAAAVLALVLVISVLRLGAATPFDEIAHFDYASKMSQGHIPSGYEYLGQQAISVFSCESPNFLEPIQCGAGPVDPKSVQWFGGVNYVSDYLPLYYATPGALIAIGQSIGLGPLTAGRLASALWIGVLAFLAAGTLMMARGSWRLALAGGLSVALLPGVVSAGTHVTNDAGAIGLVLGSSFVWFALRAHGSSLRVGAALLVAVAAVVMKQTALVALIVPLVLELRLRSSPGPIAFVQSGVRRAGTMASLLASVGIAIVGYAVVFAVDRRLRGYVTSASELWATVDAMAPSWPQFIYALPQTVVQAPLYLPQYIAGWESSVPTANPVWNGIAGMLAIVIIGGGLLRFGRGRYGGVRRIVRDPWFVSTAFLLVFPILLAAAFVAQGRGIGVQPRYLLPSLIVALVFALERVGGAHERKLLFSAGATYLVLLIYCVSY